MKNNQSFKNILRNYFNSRTSTPNIDPMWKNMDQLLTDKNFYKVNTTTNLPNQFNLLNIKLNGVKLTLLIIIPIASYLIYQFNNNLQTKNSNFTANQNQTEYTSNSELTKGHDKITKLPNTDIVISTEPEKISEKENSSKTINNNETIRENNIVTGNKNNEAIQNGNRNFNENGSKNRAKIETGVENENGKKNRNVHSNDITNIKVSPNLTTTRNKTNHSSDVDFNPSTPLAQNKKNQDLSISNNEKISHSNVITSNKQNISNNNLKNEPIIEQIAEKKNNSSNNENGSSINSNTTSNIPEQGSSTIEKQNTNNIIKSESKDPSIFFPSSDATNPQQQTLIETPTQQILSDTTTMALNNSIDKVNVKKNETKNPFQYYFSAAYDVTKSSQFQDFYINKPFYENLCFNTGIFYNLKANLALQFGISYQQLSTPSIVKITNDFLEPEDRRINVFDTFVINKIQGYNFSVGVVKSLLPNLSFNVILYTGIYSKVRNTYSHYEIETVRNSISSSKGYSPGYTSAPSWINQFQYGIQLGADYTILEKYFIGLQLQQGLRDLTNLPNGKNTLPFNYLIYAGVKI